MEERYTIPSPPDFIFKYKSGGATVLAGGSQTFLLDHIEFPIVGGIKVYLKGAEYPRKGFAYPEAVWSMNSVKRLSVEGLRFLTRKPMYPILALFLFVPHKVKIRVIEDILRSYTVIGHKIIDPHVLREQFMTPFGREIGRVSANFMINLGVREALASSFGEIVGAMFEYDDAYRYRGEDILSETSKTKLVNDPEGEVGRLFKIFCEREVAPRLQQNFGRVQKILKFSFKFKRFKQAFVNAIFTSTFMDLQYDEADRYWAKLRNDYYYFGKTFEERGGEILQGVLIKG